MHARVEACRFADQFKAMAVAKHFGDDVARFVEFACLQHGEILQGVLEKVCTFQLTLRPYAVEEFYPLT